MPASVIDLVSANDRWHDKHVAVVIDHRGVEAHVRALDLGASPLYGRDQRREGAELGLTDLALVEREVDAAARSLLAVGV